MKIGELNQHCGNCGVTSYCGNPFGFCLCTDDRFSEVDDELYDSAADSVSGLKRHEACDGCLSYGDDCDTCEYDDEARDYFCEQVADWVYRELNKAE